MYKGLFVAGTDTGVGKTEISLALIKLFQAKGVRINAMKPVSSGCHISRQGILVNEDALQLQQVSTHRFDLQNINPYAFEPAIAPHIAAREANVNICLNHIKSEYYKISEQSDLVLVEGVGGWNVPLGAQKTMQDLVQALDLSVILVVGMRLGCLNHAILTYQAIINAGLSCVAWVANVTDSHMLRVKENFNYLREQLDCPCLGLIPYLDESNIKDIEAYLDLSKII